MNRYLILFSIVFGLVILHSYASNLPTCKGNYWTNCFGTDTFRTLKATYFRLALDMVRFHQSDAEINGLSYNIDAEEGAVELFAENIMRAGDDFTYNPMETPFIPSWARVTSALPDLAYRLRRAVEMDNQEQKARLAGRSRAARHPGARGEAMTSFYGKDEAESELPTFHPRAGSTLASSRI